MKLARPAALLAFLVLSASCGRKAEAPAAENAGSAWPPPDASAGAFIPDHLRGDWKVYSHRAIGETSVPEDVAVGFRGRPVTFTLEYAAFGPDTCRRPTYHAAMLRADSVLASDYGASPSHFGFVGGATAIVTRTELRCGEQPWNSPAGLVMDMPDGHVYLVWNGTFFQLERR
jgi:hypothetical protein